MPALSMTVEVRNLEHATGLMERLAARLVDGFGPALVEIGEIGSKYFGGVAFESHGSVFGQSWAELASTTRAEKTKHWPGKPDMVRTGEMQNSFAYEVLEGTAVRLYNEAPWFVYHQSSEARHKLPRRVMIGVNDSFVVMAKGAIQKQTKAIIEEARSL